MIRIYIILCIFGCCLSCDYRYSPPGSAPIDTFLDNIDGTTYGLKQIEHKAAMCASSALQWHSCKNHQRTIAYVIDYANRIISNLSMQHSYADVPIILGYMTLIIEIDDYHSFHDGLCQIFLSAYNRNHHEWCQCPISYSIQYPLFSCSIVSNDIFYKISTSIRFINNIGIEVKDEIDRITH